MSKEAFIELLDKAYVCLLYYASTQFCSCNPDISPSNRWLSAARAMYVEVPRRVLAGVLQNDVISSSFEGVGPWVGVVFGVDEAGGGDGWFCSLMKSWKASCKS